MPNDLLTQATAAQDATPAVEGGAVAIHTEPAPALLDSTSIMAMTLQLASKQGVDKDIFNRLVEMQEKELAAQARERFNDAMNLAQAEIQPVARMAENKQTNSFYAKLEHVDAAIRPIYLKHGFNVRYNTIPPLEKGNIRVECVVSLGRHSEAFYREAASDTLGPKGTPTKTGLHGGGSTETYLKRYAVCGAFNVVFKSPGDDDGNAGGRLLLDSDQVAELVDLCKRAGQVESRFLERMVSDVHAFEEVDTKDFARLANTLRLMAEKRGASQSTGSDDAANT